MISLKKEEIEKNIGTFVKIGWNFTAMTALPKSVFPLS